MKEALKSLGWTLGLLAGFAVLAGLGEYVAHAGYAGPALGVLGFLACWGLVHVWRRSGDGYGW